MQRATPVGHRWNCKEAPAPRTGTWVLAGVEAVDALAKEPGLSRGFLIISSSTEHITAS